MPKPKNKPFCTGTSATLWQCSWCKEYATYSLTGLRLQEKKNHPNVLFMQCDPKLFCKKCNIVFTEKEKYLQHTQKYGCHKAIR